MISLFIDTSTSFVTIVILKDLDILFSFNDNIKDDMSSKILSIIDNGLNCVNICLNDIDKIYVVNGPGSFTGVRIGVTIAKAIAFSLKKSICTISSLEFMATTKSDKKYIVPIIDARRGNVFAGIYDANLNVIKSDALINFEELKSSLNEDYEIISNNNIYNSISTKYNISKIIKKHINDSVTNPHDIKPNYLKLTEAEEKRLNDQNM